MAHSEERRNSVLEILRTKAKGNSSKCARLTGIDRKTILRWKEEYDQTHKDLELSSELPDSEKIKERIIRRVYEIIDTCNDPKKLMDTYEAISKFQKESGQNRVSIFEVIERKLEEK